MLISWIFSVFFVEKTFQIMLNFYLYFINKQITDE